MGLPAHVVAAFRLGELPTARALDERTWQVVVAGHVVARVTRAAHFTDGWVAVGVPGGVVGLRSVVAADAWGYEHRRLLGFWPSRELHQAAHASIVDCMGNTARGPW